VVVVVVVAEDVVVDVEEVKEEVERNGEEEFLGFVLPASVFEEDAGAGKKILFDEEAGEDEVVDEEVEPVGIEAEAEGEGELGRPGRVAWIGRWVVDEDGVALEEEEEEAEDVDDEVGASGVRRAPP
jgi:hypothetical protein